MNVIFHAESAFASELPTVYDNVQNYPVGSRAAGMGGAYTALACDESALHYNPAALACSGASRLEVAANAYMIQGVSIPGALGEGQDISGTTYHSLPSIVGGVYILSEGDETTKQGRIGAGFVVTIPQSIALKIDPSNSTNRTTVTASYRDEILVGEMGFGYQVAPDWSIGASVGGVLRTVTGTLTVLAARAIPNSTSHEFAMATQDSDLFALGARAKIGTRYLPTPEWAFGLVVTSPTIDIYGKAQINATQGGAAVDATTGTIASTAFPGRYNGKSSVGMPFRIASGVAYMREKYTLSLDVSMNLPRDVRSAYELQSATVDNVTPPQEPDQVQKYELQPNANIGAEFLVHPKVAIDVGAFTDLSAVPANTATDRIQMFGGTLALGLLGKQVRGYFGAGFEYGEAISRVNYSLTDLQDVETSTTVRRWTAFAFIGSTYSFTED